MSVHLKSFHNTKWHQHHVKARRLEHPKSIIEKLNANPLIKLLLDDDATINKKEKVSRWTVIPHTVINSAKVLIRIVFVVVIFYAAALIFAYLEDESVHHDMAMTNDTAEVAKTSSLWSHLQAEYNIELNINDYKVLRQKINQHIEQIKILKMEQATTGNGDLSHLKIQKWFYFVIIACTTIGYGDVTPKSKAGKMFYCCFSVFGIMMMMSLLTQCSVIIMAINNSVFDLMSQYMCPPLRRLREETINLILTTVLFLSYLSFGIAHDNMDYSEEHNLVDTIYYWIASFTTTGFGDIGHPLEFEIQHAYELTVYRVFGLSLVAALIDSILMFIKLRGEITKDEAEDRRRIQRGRSV